MIDSPPEYTLGCESLPAYLPSLQFYGLAVAKSEFALPYCCCGSRSWTPVILCLNSTQLNIYEFKSREELRELIIGLFFEMNLLEDLFQKVQDKKQATEVSKFSKDTDFSRGVHLSLNPEILKYSAVHRFKDRRNKNKLQKAIKKHISSYYEVLRDNKLLLEPSELMPDVVEKYQGELRESFTLSNSTVGEAPSLNLLFSSLYLDKTRSLDEHDVNTLVKFRNTLRVRLEMLQLLLQFWSFHGMALWLRNLTIGKVLSMPLESRGVSSFKSIRSRNSRRNNALLIATEVADNYRRYQDYASLAEEDNYPSSDNVRLPDFGGMSDVSVTRATNHSPISSKGQGSVSSAESSSTNSSSLSKKTEATIIINGYKIISNESVFTPVEKQYVSNCFPKLKSSDCWSRHLITISNYERFIARHKPQKNKPDLLYIPWGNCALLDSKQQRARTIARCKHFAVDQRGLFALKST